MTATMMTPPKKNFEFIEPKIRATVKERAWKSRGRKSGAEIRVPKDWQAKTVRVSVENDPNEKPLENLRVAGSYSYAYVSMPTEWVGKSVIVELLD